MCVFVSNWTAVLLPVTDPFPFLHCSECQSPRLLSQSSLQCQLCLDTLHNADRILQSLSAVYFTFVVGALDLQLHRQYGADMLAGWT